MKPLHDFKCPQCSRITPMHKDIAMKRDVHHRFYKCRSDDCRCHFVVQAVKGYEPYLHHRSPSERRTPKDALVFNMGCPECGQYGKTEWCQRRSDGYWRRHKCPRCGPYYTCKTDEGLSIHKKLKSLHPIEL